MQDNKLEKINENLERLCDILTQIDDVYVTRRSQMNALIADMKAVDAEMAGMMVDNVICSRDERELDWSGEDFRAAAARYMAIAGKLRDMDENEPNNRN